MSSRSQPGAGVASLIAANKARLEAAAASAAKGDNSNLLLPPPQMHTATSPSGSGRQLRTRSPQGTRTDPGFVSQPKDSRVAVHSPLSKQPSKSGRPIVLSSSDEDKEENYQSSSESDSTNEDEESSPESSPAGTWGKRGRKKKDNNSKKKRAKAGKGKGRGKSQKSKKVSRFHLYRFDGFEPSCEFIS